MASTSDSSGTLPEQRRSRARKTKNYPEEEDRCMLDYMAKRARAADTPLLMSSFWKEFIEESGSKRSVGGLQSRFRRHHVNRISQMTQYDWETRIRLAFATSSPLDPGFHEQIISRNASVVLGNHGSIVEYRDENLTLIADEPSRKRQRVEDEQEDMESEDDEEEEYEIPKKQTAVLPDSLEEAKPQYLIYSSHEPSTSSLFANSDGPINFAPTAPNRSSHGDSGGQEMKELMSVMKDFVSTQTQWIRMQIDQNQSTSSPTTPQSSAPPSLQDAPPRLSSRKTFLHLLRGAVLGMDLPELEQSARRITREIERIGDGDEKISNETIKTTMETMLDDIGC